MSLSLNDTPLPRDSVSTASDLTIAEDDLDVLPAEDLDSDVEYLPLHLLSSGRRFRLILARQSRFSFLQGIFLFAFVIVGMCLFVFLIPWFASSRRQTPTQHKSSSERPLYTS